MPALPTDHNQLVYSVSEISGALKRTVEDHFGYVRVRGEVSGYRGPHSSGHAYFKVKDADAVMDAVCWKGSMAKLPFKLEEGMEVVCTGKITTYPARSNYQIMVTSIEPAGVGALMAMLEARKAKLGAEGLFDAARKRPLPFLPQTIGIITSPTGAVIRDILHRLRDRWPVHVLLWPVLVQGEGAAEQVARAIAGFNALPTGGDVPRPDLLIVARGGGSIEDLWAFNEEIVVRAAANSAIPLISAVGHETDTTLIDFASDKRAPTPTAAAEIAVPVRDEWQLAVQDYGARIYAGTFRLCQRKADQLRASARGLPRAQDMLGQRQQTVDELTVRLEQALPRMVERKEQQLALAARGLPRLADVFGRREQTLQELGARLPLVVPRLLERKQQQLALAARGLSVTRMQQDTTRKQERLADIAQRATRAFQQGLQQGEQRIAQLSAVLESVNPERVLQRGYALVLNADGAVQTSGAAIASGERLHLVFADTTRVAVAE